MRLRTLLQALAASLLLFLPLHSAGQDTDSQATLTNLLADLKHSYGEALQSDSLLVENKLRREELSEMVKAADPTRPVDHASGWFDQGGGDLRSIHNYFRPLKVEREARPCVLTEYGGINSTIPGHSMSEEVYGYQKSDPVAFPDTSRAPMDQISQLKADGLAGAVYTQVSDIEEETNGILTYDRKVMKLGDDEIICKDLEEPATEIGD